MRMKKSKQGFMLLTIHLVFTQGTKFCVQVTLQFLYQGSF